MARERPDQAVVDPNVLVSAAISAHGPPARILEAWLSGRFEMIVSYDLLYELEAVLLRDKFRGKLTVGDVFEYVLWIRERSTFVEAPVVEAVGQVMGPDPDDYYLYLLAVGYGTDFLVSGDPHLLGLPVGGPIRVVSPRQFLEDLDRQAR